jgi:hypothetical protein
MFSSEIWEGDRDARGMAGTVLIPTRGNDLYTCHTVSGSEASRVASGKTLRYFGILLWKEQDCKDGGRFLLNVLMPPKIG